MISSWQAPLPDGTQSEELLAAFDQGRSRRVLILPALFDEANKQRRFTVQTMHALDVAGVDSFLPDWPGCNESLAPLDAQSLESWIEAARAAAKTFDATHVLAIRAGALVAPPDLPGWFYAPQSGAKVLRAMIRARIIAGREAGREETAERLLEAGRQSGLTLAGWPLGADMVCELEAAKPLPGERETIEQSRLGGAGLWLRAEPSEDQAQSQALAAIVAQVAEQEA